MVPSTLLMQAIIAFGLFANQWRLAVRSNKLRPKFYTFVKEAVVGFVLLVSDPDALPEQNCFWVPAEPAGSLYT